MSPCPTQVKKTKIVDRDSAVSECRDNFARKLHVQALLHAINHNRLLHASAHLTLLEALTAISILIYDRVRPWSRSLPRGILYSVRDSIVSLCLPLHPRGSLFQGHGKWTNPSISPRGLGIPDTSCLIWLKLNAQLSYSGVVVSEAVTLQCSLGVS